MARTISGKTTTLALIGDPVGHSLSPQMHNYACELLGLDYVYVAYTVREDGVPAAFDAMRALGIRGFNVTMPCKIAAFENVDKRSEAAAIIGACNTVINDGGVLTEGYVNMLRDKGIEVAGKKVIVCGAGGAGTAIAVQCALDGARAVSIFNRKSRSWDRALQTAEKIRKVRPGCAVKVCDLTDQALLAEEITNGDILANATNLGMKPHEDLMAVEDLSVFRPGLVVTDAVYNPLETRMLRLAKEAGCITFGGKGMLLWQGVSAFRLFTGRDMPVEQVRARYFAD